jgi:3-phenylpropionate/trans-cinnamate dioxygenase ferredoxin reductase subunit
MERYEYVIIGGGMAGGRACEGIRKVDEGGRVVLVTDEAHRPYERPPLSKEYMVGEKGLSRVYLRPEGYYPEHNVDVWTGVRATEVSPASNVVTFDNGEQVRYGKLLLATGGRAKRLPLPGNDLPGVFTLRTIDDSDAIKEAAETAERALVLGGSFIGSEVASSLTQLGVDVTMVFPESRLLERIVPEELSVFLHQMYKDRGVQLIPEATAQRLSGSATVAEAQLDNGETLSINMVVMGVGINLNTQLAREAGLELTEEGAIVVDQYLRTSNHDIYAAGDIAAWPSVTFRETSLSGGPKRLRVEHWDVARSQGLRAGGNMAGDEAPYTTLPYFFSDLFEFSFEAWGDLSEWEETVLRGDLERGSFAYFYFREARLVGVLAVGRPDGERKPMQKLVRLGPQHEKIAAALRAEETDLSRLIS